MTIRAQTDSTTVYIAPRVADLPECVGCARCGLLVYVSIVLTRPARVLCLTCAQELEALL